MNGLHWIDGIIIVTYAGAMLALGWYYSRRQQSTDEYFTGGRAMNPVLVGVSLFATLMSTISYLSSPGEIIKNGPIMLAGTVSVPIGYLIVGYILIPTFMKYRLTSAYELLEIKLGVSTRLLGAAMFIALRVLWMSTLLNFAAEAMLVILGWDSSWLLPVTIVIGTVALIYSALGGLQAVVITDAAQFILLFGGAVMIVAVVTFQLGGFSWFPTEWDPAWKPQPVFSLDPYLRMTVVGVIAMQTLWTVCTAGADQTAVQRFMATKDAAAARRSYLVNSVVGLAVTVVMTLVGLALKGYCEAVPSFVPAGETVASYADRLFPHFIANKLPIGIAGLVVSGMFAAAMSSIDSGVNSISAVVLRDFVDRFRQSPVDQVTHVRIARSIAIVVGSIVVGGSTLIPYVQGNLLEVSKRVVGVLVAPLFTLFFMALFVRRASVIGTNVGALSGFASAILVSYWSPIVEERALSMTLISPTALTVGVTVGFVVSCLFPKKANAKS